MIKNYSLLLIALFSAFVSSFGQTKIAELTFETTGGYTTSVTEFTDSGTDYFTRTNGSNIGGGVSLSNIQGSYYFAAQDTDADISTLDILNLNFSGITITGYTNLELRIHIAEDDDGSNQDWDANTFLHITGTVDTGSPENLIWVEAASGTNTEPRLDTNFDGTGNGTAITDTFSQFTNSITGTGNNLNIQVIFNYLDAGDEDIAIDNIEIWGTSSCTDELDFVNIQWPNTTQTITVGDNLNVYSQAYEPGVTPGAGQGANIEAWIGYNTVNNNPNTSGWTWIPASFNTQVGNNDEYLAEIGSALAPGTYYYASRYRLNSCDFTYGGTGGNWNNDSVQLIVQPDQVNFCNVDYPKTATIAFGGTHNVYAQAYEPGVTDAAGQGANLQAWIGYNTIGINHQPWSATGWTWVPATYDSDSGNNDQYVAEIGSGRAAGTYYYASRFQLNGSDYSYGGIQADNSGNFWDTTNNNGTLIVNSPPIANIVITEIMYNTSGTDDEWIEICNISGSTQDISSYIIDVDGTTEFTFPASTTIASGSCITVSLGSNGDGIYNNACPFTPDYGVGASTSNTNNLVNSSDPITIYAANGTTVADTVTYSDLDGANGNDSSLHVIDATQNNVNTSSNWQEVTFGGSPGTNSLTSPCAIPEIDIERNSGSSIPDGATANAGYNTIFAATTIGSSSAPKTFHISNEGGADLNVTSIVSSNNAEFAITLNPGASTITPGTEIDFEITFSPTNVGLRTAIITILSNDADENPYTFNVQGNGDCVGASLAFLPNNGPVGTIVNITSSSSGFGSSTSAVIGGIAATVTLISSSEIEVTIPNGAETGSIEINDDLGCLSSSLFTVIDQLISDCDGSTGSTPSDIYISEISDHGSGSHSYIELFNGTGASVNLIDYEIRIHNNGAASATNTIPLSGTLVTNDVFVIAFGSTDATNPNATHGYDLSDNASGINEDDNIRLYNTTTSTWIDLWGDTSGNVFTIASKDYTYRRKNTGIVAPSTTWNSSDWNSFTPVDYSDIGNYDFSTGLPPTITVQPSPPISNCNLTTTLSVTAVEGFPGGNSLAYQWYYSAPGNISWTAISNNATYSGATNNTLNVLNTLTLNDYQYYCEVRENTATCHTASKAVRLKTISTTWDGTNWTNSTPPDINTIAIIDGDYNTTTNGSFSACQLIVNASNLLVVSIGDYVEVQNNVNVYGDGTNTDGILVEDKGSFIQRGDGVNAGTYTLHTNAKTQVNKRTAPLNNYYEYTYWSSPVVGETIGNGLLEAHPTRRYWYNGQNYLDQTKETDNNNATVTGQDDVDDNGDDWQFANNNDVMEPAVGYAAMHSQIGFNIPGANYEYTFEGALHTGDYDVAIYRNDLETNDNNWNFIGNPYASAIDADAFLLVNTVIDQNVSETIPGGVTDGAIFLWSQNSPYSDTNNGNEVLNFAQSDFAVINGTGQTAGGDGIMPSRYIPSGQGFFISLSDAATTTIVSGNIKTADVTFLNSMRVTGNNNQFFRNSTNNNQTEKLWINLTSDNGVFNQVLIGYIEGATNAYDGMYFDTPKNLSTGSHSILYSIIEDVNGKDKLSIQGKSPESLDLSEIIPLGFKTSVDEATIYTISVAQFEGEFLTNNTIYLYDRFMNIFHDLNASNYSFTSESGEHNDRFEIVFNPDSLSVDENQLNNALTIIELQDGSVKFTISNNLEIKNVKIYDTLGRLLYNLNGNSSTEIYNLNNLNQAAYLAKVTLSNDVVITKKAIKRN